MMAARRGYVSVIEAVLAGDANVNSVDHRGKTALSLLVENLNSESIEGVNKLLDYGADAMVDDDDGVCALEYLREQVNMGVIPLNDNVRSIAGRMKNTMRNMDIMVRTE